MSRRPFYDNPGRVNIDTRPPSAEKAMGFTNIHRDTDGTVIGAIDANGYPLGNKRRQGPVDGSSLGNPITPGLDRWRKMNPSLPDETPAQREARKRQEAAASGAFGAGAKNLADRQTLYKDMLDAGRSGITPAMQARAKSLGVSTPAWQRVADSVPKIPAQIASPTPQFSPLNPSLPDETPAQPSAPIMAQPTRQIAPQPTQPLTIEMPESIKAMQLKNSQSKWDRQR